MMAAPKDESVAMFITWEKSMTNSGFKQIVYRGNLSRTDVAKGCGFAKSVLTQNPEVRKMLARLEDRLRETGVLPKATEAKIESDRKPKKYDGQKNKQNQEQNRLRKLEQENLELKAKLRRLEELSEVLSEMGVSV
ncbi:MAG: VPA1267 family protein [Marinobacter sp.]|nr:VPA1267 family protein [Marinobacter sp.]